MVEWTPHRTHDERLNKRLRKLLKQLGDAMGQSTPLVCQDWANTKAVYRFFAKPLLSRTGRNQPSTSENILGNAKWWRGPITPLDGCAVVEIDWSGQENAIAAGQSGDATMRHAYESGDIHMATAILCGLGPAGATEGLHAPHPCAHQVSGGTSGRAAAE
jgi:hypothetical protein